MTIGVPDAAASTAGQLLGYHMDSIRGQMNEHVPGDYRTMSEASSIAGSQSRFPSPSYGSLRPPQSSSGDYSGHSRPPVSFATPPLPPAVNHLRSSGDGTGGIGLKIRKKLSIREGLAKVFNHSRKPSSDRGNGHKRSSSEVKSRHHSDEYPSSHVTTAPVEPVQQQRQPTIPRIATASRLHPLDPKDYTRRDKIIDIIGGMV